MHGIYRQSNLPYLAKKICPKCEKPIDKNTLACPYCSYTFIVTTKKQTQRINPSYLSQINYEEKEPTPVEKVIYCESCGTKLLAGTKFCSNCGTKITKSFCPYCGEAIDDRQTYCPHCGKQVKQKVETPSVVEVPTNVSNEQESVAGFKDEVINNEVAKENVALASQEVEAAKEEVKETAVEEVKENPQEEKEEPKEEMTSQETTSQDSIVEQPVEQESQKEPTEASDVKEENNNQQAENKENEASSDTKEEKFIPNEEYDKIILRDFVNMERKRFFLVIEVIASILIMLVALLVPIMNAGSFTGSFTTLMSQPFTEFDKTLTETGKLTNGIYLIKYLIGEFSSGNIFPAISDLPSEMLAIDGTSICSYSIGSLTFSNVVVNYFVVIFYMLLAVMFVVSLLSCLVHAFATIPYKVRSFGLFTIVLLIGSIGIYIQKFIPGMVAYDNGYDSWVIYGFGVSFFIWFIMKLVFMNEAKKYKKIKEYKKQKAEFGK